MFMEILFIYLALINLFSVCACIFDKISAVHGGWRVSEKNLLLMCVMGGSVAMYLTMRIIRHKTRHNKFMIGIPIIIFLQLTAVFLVVYLL